MIVMIVMIVMIIMMQVIGSDGDDGVDYHNDDFSDGWDNLSYVVVSIV